MSLGEGIFDNNFSLLAKTPPKQSLELEDCFGGLNRKAKAKLFSPTPRNDSLSLNVIGRGKYLTIIFPYLPKYP